MIQIEVENGTVFRRRIFMNASQLALNEPIPLALTAWYYFDLAPGGTVGTVDGDFQIGVRVTPMVHGVDHRTVVVDASYGDAWRVDLSDGIPVLSRTTPGNPNSLDVVNALTGPESSTINVTLYRNYEPLLNREVAANGRQEFACPVAFYCYSSMPIDNDGQPLTFEPIVGKVDLRDPKNLRLQIVPSGNTIQWKVNGKPADLAGAA